jgi:hypothetical protein
MRKGDIESRYREHYRKESRILDEFAAHEGEWADDLLFWYRTKKVEIPDDEYRAVAFFKNREYVMKPGSLTLLYSMYQKMLKELPQPTPELAFDLLTFRFRVYAKTLEKGGY